MNIDFENEENNIIIDDSQLDETVNYDDAPGWADNTQGEMLNYKAPVADLEDSSLIALNVVKQRYRRKAALGRVSNIDVTSTSDEVRKNELVLDTTYGFESVDTPNIQINTDTDNDLKFLGMDGNQWGDFGIDMAGGLAIGLGTAGIIAGGVVAAPGVAVGAGALALALGFNFAARTAWDIMRGRDDLSTWDEKDLARLGGGVFDVATMGAGTALKVGGGIAGKFASPIASKVSGIMKAKGVVKVANQLQYGSQAVHSGARLGSNIVSNVIQGQLGANIENVIGGEGVLFDPYGAGAAGAMTLMMGTGANLANRSSELNASRVKLGTNKNIGTANVEATTRTETILIPTEPTKVDAPSIQSGNIPQANNFKTSDFDIVNSGKNSPDAAAVVPGGIIQAPNQIRNAPRIGSVEVPNQSTVQRKLFPIENQMDEIETSKIISDPEFAKQGVHDDIEPSIKIEQAQEIKPSADMFDALTNRGKSESQASEMARLLNELGDTVEQPRVIAELNTLLGSMIEDPGTRQVIGNDWAGIRKESLGKRKEVTSESLRGIFKENAGHYADLIKSIKKDENISRLTLSEDSKANHPALQRRIFDSAKRYTQEKLGKHLKMMDDNLLESNFVGLGRLGEQARTLYNYNNLDADSANLLTRMMDPDNTEFKYGDLDDHLDLLNHELRRLGKDPRNMDAQAVNAILIEMAQLKDLNRISLNDFEGVILKEEIRSERVIEGSEDQGTLTTNLREDLKAIYGDDIVFKKVDERGVKLDEEVGYIGEGVGNPDSLTSFDRTTLGNSKGLFHAELRGFDPSEVKARREDTFFQKSMQNVENNLSESYGALINDPTSNVSYMPKFRLLDRRGVEQVYKTIGLKKVTNDNGTSRLVYDEDFKGDKQQQAFAGERQIRTTVDFNNAMLDSLYGKAGMTSRNGIKHNFETIYQNLHDAEQKVWNKAETHGKDFTIKSGKSILELNDAELDSYLTTLNHNTIIRDFGSSESTHLKPNKDGTLESTGRQTDEKSPVVAMDAYKRAMRSDIASGKQLIEKYRVAEKAGGADEKLVAEVNAYFKKKGNKIAPDGVNYKTVNGKLEPNKNLRKVAFRLLNETSGGIEVSLKAGNANALSIFNAEFNSNFLTELLDPAYLISKLADKTSRGVLNKFGMIRKAKGKAIAAGLLTTRTNLGLETNIFNSAEFKGYAMMAGALSTIRSRDLSTTLGNGIQNWMDISQTGYLTYANHKAELLDAITGFKQTSENDFKWLNENRKDLQRNPWGKDTIMDTKSPSRTDFANPETAQIRDGLAKSNKAALGIMELPYAGYKISMQANINDLARKALELTNLKMEDPNFVVRGTDNDGKFRIINPNEGDLHTRSLAETKDVLFDEMYSTLTSEAGAAQRALIAPYRIGSADFDMRTLYTTGFAALSQSSASLDMKNPLVNSAWSTGKLALDTTAVFSNWYYEMTRNADSRHLSLKRKLNTITKKYKGTSVKDGIIDNSNTVKAYQEKFMAYGEYIARDLTPASVFGMQGTMRMMGLVYATNMLAQTFSMMLDDEASTGIGDTIEELNEGRKKKAKWADNMSILGALDYAYRGISGHNPEDVDTMNYEKVSTDPFDVMEQTARNINDVYLAIMDLVHGNVVDAPGIDFQNRPRSYALKTLNKPMKGVSQFVNGAKNGNLEALEGLEQMLAFLTGGIYTGFKKGYDEFTDYAYTPKSETISYHIMNGTAKQEKRTVAISSKAAEYKNENWFYAIQRIMIAGFGGQDEIVQEHFNTLFTSPKSAIDDIENLFDK